MKASLFYRIAAVLLLFFAAGHTLGFRQSDPNWGVDTFLAQCGQFILTCRGLAGHIGTFLLRLDSLSAYFIFSPRY
jgi:hypothetical protein